MQDEHLERPGCLRAAAGALLLILLAPWAALVRLWRVLRRGHDGRIRWTITGAPGPDGTDGWWRLDLEINVPLAAGTGTRTGLIDTLIRIAETLRQPDDLHNLIVQQRGDEEPRLIAVGPSLQQLAERLERSFSHRDAERCTHLWLTLPRSRRLGRLVDPMRFDPEGDGALDRLVADTSPRWAAATSFGQTGAAVVYRVILVAAGNRDRVRTLLERLKTKIEGAV